MVSRGGDVRTSPSSPAGGDALGMADDAIDVLLDAGWHPGNIALLTTSSRHPVQIELTESRGQGGYWRKRVSGLERSCT